jgi:hypothetical protein
VERIFIIQCIEGWHNKFQNDVGLVEFGLPFCIYYTKYRNHNNSCEHVNTMYLFKELES